ncbi:SDR family oxidoreductase [Lachnospiraceae bacterium ZAX-1]
MSKILLVTGASSDVGKCLIEHVANNYDTIICHYHSSTAIIEDLNVQFGDRIVPLQADFADAKQTDKFVQMVLERGLAPEHFVHLSSSNSSSVDVRFGKTDRKSFETELAITFLSAVVCCQAFVPLMTKAKCGKVIFMLSSLMMGKPAKPYLTAYTCVKHALSGLMESLSAEYARKGVTVNAVSPSMMDTKFLKIPDIVKEINASASPLKRLLTPSDVAPAFEFLLSSGADTVTGQNIPVTGGA